MSHFICDNKNVVFLNFFTLEKSCSSDAPGGNACMPPLGHPPCRDRDVVPGKETTEIFGLKNKQPCIAMLAVPSGGQLGAKWGVLPISKIRGFLQSRIF
jgi:hypothetical protein